MEAQNDSRITQVNEQILRENYLTAPEEKSQGKVRSSRIPYVAGCLIGLLVIICLGSVTSIAGAVLGITSENQEEWLELTNAFMQAMADKKIDQAYSLFSKEAQGSFSQADLTSFVDGPFYTLFDGYLDLEMESFYINFGFPEGKTVELTGLINYQKDYTGNFVFTLIKKGNTWKLLSFNVEAPPEKFNDYSVMQP